MAISTVPIPRATARDPGNPASSSACAVARGRTTLTPPASIEEGCGQEHDGREGVGGHDAPQATRGPRTGSTSQALMAARTPS